MSYQKMPSRTLVSQNDAAQIQNARIPRSRFINNWNRKTAFDAGILYPFMVDEILPGDHMKYDVTAYLRIQTLLFPLLDNQRIDTHFFFIPNRLLWDNWPKFMGEQDTPASSIAYSIPYIESPLGGFGNFTLYDHMGIPSGGQIDPAEIIRINALPIRAYALIYNTWFRDQNIIDSTAYSKTDGPDVYTSYTLKRRAKSHDYFTSALPWPQKFTAPTVPLGGQAKVAGIGFRGAPTDIAAATWIDSVNPFGIAWAHAGALHEAAGDWGAEQLTAAGTPNIYADLSTATGVAINTLRQAWMIQTLLERDARGGTRYTELIRSHFGVINPDFRLQRPEYIGGGQTQLSVTPIAQTAPTAGVPLGALGGAGTAVGQHRASYAATEHGYILGLISVKSELSYQQGLHKMWTRSTRYDFYDPALAGLGEQAILRQELYCNGVNTQDETVFGYQARWEEYRQRMSEVTGYMKSTVPGTLDGWHLAQRFTGPPVLDSAFINDTPPMTRVQAAGAAANDQQYLADINITRIAIRPIPTFGTPSLIGGGSF